MLLLSSFLLNAACRKGSLQTLVLILPVDRSKNSFQVRFLADFYRCDPILTDYNRF
ncbi:hypothetical protein Hanom_Chr05g00434051 [Helianthus anomalus]